MAVLKLSLDEFDEVDYDLIAIHSTLEDYRLAYFINQKLPIILSKCKDQVSVTVKEGEVFFPRFTYDDSINDIVWSLIPNKNEITVHKNSTGQNLFLNTQVEISTNVYLISELKNVDYFLKLENNKYPLVVDDALRKLKTIIRVAGVYTLLPDTIKSKNNLIF